MPGALAGEAEIATSGTTVAYEAVNEINGHRYVGVTVNGVTARRQRHLSDARCGSHLRFHRAIRKYGEEAFRFTVIGDFGDDFELALAFEAEEIAKTRPEYNVSAGGRQSQLGRRHTAEAKAKMSAALKGRVGPWKGKKRPPETIEKMRAAAASSASRHWLGKKRPEIGPKVSAAKKGRRQSPEEIESRRPGLIEAWKKRSAPIVERSSGMVFQTVKEAAAYYGLSVASVHHRLYRPNSATGTLRFSRVAK